MVTRKPAVTYGEYATDDVLVDPAWLEDHLRDPTVRVVEVDVSPAAYDDWHIDGAVLWNVYRDVKDADYRLVDKAEIERLLARSGIAPDSTVVFYGYAPAMGFWLVKLYGHADARLLNCQRETWHEEGRPRTKDAQAPALTSYRLPDEDLSIRADSSEVETAIDDPVRTIVDVRSTLEFRGERFWPSGGLEEGGRAGHIPSAINISLDDLHDESGAFANVAELRDMFSSIDLSDRGELISYCTIGGRACAAWFALTYLLGRQHVRVYDGSWAEWGRMPEASVVTNG